jgi:hypothetical protein
MARHEPSMEPKRSGGAIATLYKKHPLIQSLQSVGFWTMHSKKRTKILILSISPLRDRRIS